MKPYTMQTDALTVGYKKPLIHDIAMNIRPGEIIVLIGPNGAGKTTILRSLIGQLEPLSGVVYVEGTPLLEAKQEQLSKTLSVVLTDTIHSERMTCRDIAAMGRYPYTGRFGILSREDHAIVEETLELVHALDYADRPFSQVSDGQRQRILLAKALCQQPKILVLDEPTSFLDLHYKLEFLSILQHMAKHRGLSVIISLHELELAQRIADRVLCICGDHIDRFGPPEEIFADSYICTLYGISEGSYHAHSGTAELPAPQGSPRIFVLSGGGTGAAVFRQLQRKGIPFSTGILWKNDLDYPVAKALATHTVSIPAFSTISESLIKETKDAMMQCGKVLCTLSPEQAALVNCFQELLDFAQKHELLYTLNDLLNMK